MLAEDLDQLYDDQFIETCAPWVIPYIGDLIGYQSVKGIAPAIDNPRSEVADTISLRRRKGTVLVMEQLARDVTGWGAHAVEFFQVLGDTQYMNHLRLWNHYAPDLRRWKPGLYIETGFDRTAHKVDVRRIAARRGRYNIQNIGIFLWSLNAYSVTDAAASAASTTADARCLASARSAWTCRCFTARSRRASEITDRARAVQCRRPAEAPRALRRPAEGRRRGVLRRGQEPRVYLDGEPLNPYEIEVANLSGADGSWANMPGRRQPLSRGRRSRARPHRAAAGGRRSRRCRASRCRITTASTPTWAAANMRARDSFVVEDEPFVVLPFPTPPACRVHDAAARRWTSPSGNSTANGAAAVEIIEQRDLSAERHARPRADVPAGCTIELRAADGRASRRCCSTARSASSGGASQHVRR